VPEVSRMRKFSARNFSIKAAAQYSPTLAPCIQPAVLAADIPANATAFAIRAGSSLPCFAAA